MSNRCLSRSIEDAYLIDIMNRPKSLTNNINITNMGTTYIVENSQIVNNNYVNDKNCCSSDSDSCSDSESDSGSDCSHEDETTYIDTYGVNGLVKIPEYDLQYLYLGTPVSLYIKHYIENNELCFSFFGSNNLHINDTILAPYSYIHFTITDNTPSIILYEFSRSKIISIFIKKYKLINFSFNQPVYINYTDNNTTKIIPAMLNIIYKKLHKSLALELTAYNGDTFTKNTANSFYSVLIPKINFALDSIKNITAKKNKVVPAPTP